MQYATVGPPQNIIVTHICFAMASVPAAQHCLPETAGQFRTADIAPSMLNIALVGDLIANHRLSVSRAPFVHIFRGAVIVLTLDTGMRNPRPGMIVESDTIMN